MSEKSELKLVSTFFIGDTRWGINTMKTQEVIKIPDITMVHHAPNYVEGIINLRGKIVTIISLSDKLKIPTRGTTDDSRIIIVNDGEEFVGLLVDSISDVIEIEQVHLMEAPATVNGTKGQYFDGIYHKGDTTVAILNLGNVLVMEEEPV